MNTFTHIYSLSDPNTGEIRYIGKADDLKIRFNKHKCDSELKPKTHKNNWIESLKKNGLLPVIELIETVPKNNWAFYETQYILIFRSFGANLVNATSGGEGVNNLKHSEETKDKIRKALTGYKHSEKTKLKHKESNVKFWLGKKRPGIGSKISISKTGKKLSDDHKNKISQSHKGIIFTAEHRANLSKNAKLRKNRKTTNL